MLPPPLTTGRRQATLVHVRFAHLRSRLPLLRYAGPRQVPEAQAVSYPDSACPLLAEA